MNSSTAFRIYKTLFVVVFALSNLTAKAQLSAALSYKSNKTDTALIVSSAPENKEHTAAYSSAGISIFQDVNDNTLQKKISVSLSKSKERRQLMEYLKQLEVDDSNIAANESKNKALFRFANLFARLKLYPLAMKCFFKTVQRDKKQMQNETVNTIDTLQESNEELVDLPINTKDDSLAFLQSEQVKKIKSPRTTYATISSTFNDGKQAIAYALLFHVKQPAPGKKKVHVLANTGHTYITLIKYNTDSTYVSCSFGFYPKKEHLLSATPWFPSTSAQFKDDASHKWDEVIGKFISKRKFNKILNLTKEYDDLDYHLSYNNCTDFSLQAASMAGISISNTTGSWLLGHGNNPGVTGQSIIQGAYSTTDGQPATMLFKSLNTSITQEK